MNILITGVGPHNKGAELMLLAILEQLASTPTEVRPVMAAETYPYTWRAGYGLYQLLDSRRIGRLGWLRTKLFHDGYRDRYGLVLDKEIDVVLDASGYAFGDSWPASQIEGKARQFEIFKKFGARIVLLPQALGPFNDPEVRSASARVLNSAEVVFARDSKSMEHCRSISPHHIGLMQAPDFTNLVAGVCPGNWKANRNYVAFVPNRKVLTNAPGASGMGYIQLMQQILSRVTECGYSPLLVVHEQCDLGLIENIGIGFHDSLKVCNEKSPKNIKGVLGTCAFTIGSRFHALVSSLSQGVPSLSIGWSHKYERLFSEFGMDEWAYTMDGDEARVLAGVEKLLVPEIRSVLSVRLQERAAEQRHAVQNMWSKTLALIS